MIVDNSLGDAVSGSDVGRYRIRRDTARTWVLERLVRRAGGTAWQGWKYGSLELLAQLLLNLAIPTDQAFLEAADIRATIAAAEARVLKSLELATAGQPGGVVFTL